MYFAQALYRLNIMFRHMPVPRDTCTSVSRQIIIVCCESVGNCQTLSKDGPSQLVSSIIFRPFFLFFASDVHRFLPILSRSDVRPPRVLHIVFMFINRQHVYNITWYSVMWRYFRFSSERLKLNLWPSVRILITYILINCEWFIIKLCGIGIILLTDLLCGITSYYFSVDLRFDCTFKATCTCSYMIVHKEKKKKEAMIPYSSLKFPFQCKMIRNIYLRNKNEKRCIIA